MPSLCMHKRLSSLGWTRAVGARRRTKKNSLPPRKQIHNRELSNSPGRNSAAGRGSLRQLFSREAYSPALCRQHCLITRHCPPGPCPPGPAPVRMMPAMRYRTLGDSGLLVSVVGLGCNNFGGRIDLQRTRAVVDAAVGAGITLFDTAEMYGKDGGSELALGEVLGGR